MKVTTKSYLRTPHFKEAYHYPVVRAKLSSELKLYSARCANNKSRCFRHLIQIMKNTNQRHKSDRAAGREETRFKRYARLRKSRLSLQSETKLALINLNYLRERARARALIWETS